MVVEVVEKDFYFQSDWHRTVEEKQKDTEIFMGYVDGERELNVTIPINKWNKGYSDEKVQLQELNSRLLNVRINSLNLDFLVAAPASESEQVGPQPFIDVSPSGNLGISASDYSTINTWDTSNFSTLRSLEGHALDVEVARFFPSGLVVLSGGMDMTVRIWDVRDGGNARTMIGHKRRVTGLEFIDKGAEVLSIGADGSLNKWNCAVGKSVGQIVYEDSELTSLSWHEKDKVLLIASNKGRIRLVSAEFEELVSFDQDQGVSSAASDGTFIYAGLFNGSILTIDSRSKEVLSIYRTNRGRVHKIQIYGEGLLISFANGSVILYKREPQTLKPVCLFTGADLQPVYDFAVNEHLLYTAGKDHFVRKYRLPAL
uniref:WD_REPEATS_REGION domain-containing protein n=1 Tax=Bursaphelenchus xylophilus TaxID=6326 RepID=A0A1I7RPF4_BURXY